ncbi:MAG: hypothetical protein KBH14_14775 [Vicinamibacteria bacterium]|nr:hypothetical protein [Vicinamibacteria bacterium]
MSLRLRVSLWNAGVMALTLAALTGAAIYEERRQLVLTEAANGAALLEHLARMPQFQADVETVASQLDLMRESLRASGSDIDLVPIVPQAPRVAEAETSSVNATRTLSLREGAFRLRYLTNPDRLQKTLRRSIEMHLLYGLVALAALLGGTEWILRRNLVLPLGALSRQIERMRDGRGWLPRERHTDEELAGVARAVAELGPALERQVHEWIEAERRSAVALAIRNIRGRLAEPETCVAPEAVMAGTQAPDGLARAGRGEDALLTERGRVATALADEEHATFGQKGEQPAAGPQ